MSFFTPGDNADLCGDPLWGASALVNGAVEIVGILDEAYIDPLGMSAAMPVFTCASDAGYAAAEGDVLDIGARRWLVTAVEPDGQGLQLLRLRVVN